MKRWVPVCLVLASLALVPPPPAAAAGASSSPPAQVRRMAPAAIGPVRLNEILAGPARDWDGSGAFSSRDDEWIEIANSGVASVDLASYVVTDGDSIPRYGLSGTLAGGATLLVTGKMSYDWERANGQPAYGLSLGNSGDSVLLWQVAGGDTTLVDAYTYTSHEAAADRSVGRSLETDEWQLFDALDPYTGTIPPMGNRCPPTPGAPNVCASVPVRGSTWGRLKAVYR